MPQPNPMDLTLAAERNRDALLRIVGMLLATLGLTDTAIAERIPRGLHRAILGILRPAEMALRRLIAFMARGIVLKPKAPRPAPEEKAIGRNNGGASRAKFRFEDIPPRNMSGGKRSHAGPRNSRGAPGHRAQAETHVAASRLAGRLLAMKNALENLPREAKRFVRWMAKRDPQQRPAYAGKTHPVLAADLPGAPAHEVETVLRDCIGLAGEASALDSS